MIRVNLLIMGLLDILFWTHSSAMETGNLNSAFILIDSSVNTCVFCRTLIQTTWSPYRTYAEGITYEYQLQTFNDHLESDDITTHIKSNNLTDNSIYRINF